MQIIQKNINIGLLTAIALTLVAKIYYVSRVTFDIDSLTEQIAPLKKLMRPETAIGYNVDTHYASEYMAIQNIMVPRILIINNDPDTLLMIRDKDEKVKGIAGYDVIAENTNGARIVSLIKRKK